MSALKENEVQSLDIQMDKDLNLHGAKSNQGFFTSFTTSKGLLGFGGSELQGSAQYLTELLGS